jgi:hypothetical protein
MFIFTERHDDGLLLRHRWCPVRGGQADDASGTSRQGNSGGIGAPITNAAPSRECHATVTRDISAAATYDSDGHTKSRAVNALFLRDLPHGVEDYPVPANSVAASHLRAQCLDDMLTAIQDWAASTGRTRTLWRQSARYEIARFRRWFLLPERRAFEEAVARQQRRAAA